MTPVCEVKSSDVRICSPPLIGIYHEGTVVRLPPQSPGGRDCLCVYFLSFGLLMLLYVSPGPTRYISYAYGTISL